MRFGTFRSMFASAFVLLTAVISAVGLYGCRETATAVTEQNVTVEARTSTVSYVCVGMETSKRFGNCPGCKLDSSRMHAFLRDKFGYGGVLLQSEQATRKAVAYAIRDGIAQTPEDGLFIFYYSGHGGQETLPSGWNTEEPDGYDEQDEYLCLYDSYLLDDEIWKLISVCRGRVFLCFDACHSQTMFRSVCGDICADRGLAVPLEEPGLVRSSGFLLKPVAMPLEEGGIRMLCWSGCLEGEYSYGSSSGGVMTNYILSRWKYGISYDDLWSSVCSGVQKEQPTQHPARVLYGNGFKEAFK